MINNYSMYTIAYILCQKGVWLEVMCACLSKSRVEPVASGQWRSTGLGPDREYGVERDVFVVHSCLRIVRIRYRIDEAGATSCLVYGVLCGLGDWRKAWPASHQIGLDVGECGK
jgi:hypothetical protein